MAVVADLLRPRFVALHGRRAMHHKVGTAANLIPLPKGSSGNYSDTSFAPRRSYRLRIIDIWEVA